MEKFHITIKNNDTGEVLVDLDTSAIIGAVDNGEGTRNLCVTCCNGRDLAATAAGALQSANAAIDLMPRGLAKKVRKVGKKNISKQERRTS